MVECGEYYAIRILPCGTLITMPSSLATVLTVCFAFFMIAREKRRVGSSSPALWLPVAWLVTAGSRFLTQWLALGDPSATGNVADGSTLDAIFFLSLILTGIFVLAGRRVVVGELFRQNPWLSAFLLFGLISILWSDFPFIAFKRWVKALGHPVMALIILTDPRPLRALQIVLKRCGYILLPFSMLFVKYLPQFGRGFEAFTGEAFNNGVGLTKNDLGCVSMATGIFFLWSALQARAIVDRGQRYKEMIVCGALLCMAIWLLDMSNSATSLSTFIVGSTTLLLLGTGLIDKRRVGLYVISAILIALTLQALFDVYGSVLDALGRDATLTDRTEIWSDVIMLQDRPLTGVGFESFWLGSRLDTMWDKWWWRPSQAHNGYIETYLNLGIIGIVLLLGSIVSAFRRIAARLSDDFEFARLRLAFLFVVVLFNYTEAGFKALHFMWTMFYIIAIEWRMSGQPKAVIGHGAVVRGMAGHR